MEKTFLFAGLAMALAGCASSPSDTPGVFAGANGAEAASQITRAANSTTGESLATGSSAGVMANAIVEILAKHPLSPRQRAVATQRARATVAHLSSSPHRKKLPRYLAVETVKDEHTAPQAKKSVVIWDTEAAEIVGHDVYDIASPPAVGATSRFETYSAEYVGAGL